MAIQSYTTTHNLHLKPLSTQILRGTWASSITLLKLGSSQGLTGTASWIASKGVLLTGSLIVIPIGLIESIALASLSFTGLALNSLFQSPFLEKHSLKCLSYSLHSAMTAIAPIIKLMITLNLRSHTANAIIDHATHFFSVLTVQTVFEAFIRRRDQIGPKITHLFLENGGNVLQDLLTQIQRDLNIDLRSKMGVPTQPQRSQFLQTIDLRRLFNDRDYRRQALQFLRNFLEEARLIRPAVGALPYQAELNQSTPEESAYQNHLAQLQKRAFLELYRTPDLSQCLNKENEEGKELLLLFDASIYMPLSYYTQYQELLEEIQCPNRFTGIRVQYNVRQDQLRSTQAKLQALTQPQKASLVQKILRGENFEAEDSVQQIYLEIARLADPLTQGPLMTRVLINLDEGVRELFTTQNLFQKGCQEAISEINAGQ